MRVINEIIVHCSATPEGKDFTVEDITRWHKDRGFQTIGYHYVIYRDGSIHKGRPLEKKGAHCLNHNAHSIGICYIGGCDKDGKTPKDTRTPEQKRALVALLKELKEKFPMATIHGHREFANKRCPCFDAFNEYKCLALMMLTLMLAACHTSKITSNEAVDSASVKYVAQSTTADAASDHLLHNMVLEIDSIVMTEMPVIIMSPSEQNVDGDSCNKPLSPLKRVVVNGVHMKSNTEVNRKSTSFTACDSTHQASKHSLDNKQTVKEDDNKTSKWILFIVVCVIAMIIAITLTKKNNPLIALLRFVLRKENT
ncbi:MAG: N-acetylmuramoyl-L-alanine amidase [Bacteroidaceae bacterium]|nr:N-acetylmuramoyl-L-alanine amidase [Bacteroidaceae bacterium]